MSRRNLWKVVTASCVLGAIFLLSAARMRADDDDTRIRWDIIALTAGPTVHPGGQASAKDNIGDRITFTGSGTFVLRAGRG